jgi:hypothetical protein
MKNKLKVKNRVDDLQDIPAEVDFRGGERGKYAHRFGEIPRDEELAAQFLRDKGFEVESIDKDRFAKTPDFRLFKKGKFVGYCEIKTFERDIWLDKMLATAGPGELAGGVKNDPVPNRISNAIHTAAKQLMSVNQNHDALNILILVNRDKQSKYQDLVSVITGKWDPLAGIHDRTHEQFSEGRIQKDKYDIDLYIWLNVNKSETPKVGGFFFGCYEKRSDACSLFGINPDVVKTVA